jgi:hypothetical protein
LRTYDVWRRVVFMLYEMALKYDFVRWAFL